MSHIHTHTKYLILREKEEKNKNHDISMFHNMSRILQKSCNKRNYLFIILKSQYLFKVISITAKLLYQY